MSMSGLEYAPNGVLEENSYNLSTEANCAALLTTGNGYMGVRASLEEYGSLGVQGCYVRGVLDEVVEVRLALADNLYMKKYYIQEDNLKQFEKQEFIINLIDFLLIRFSINGETFYPWEGKLIDWKRWLDIKTGCLHREVLWENSKGEQTRFCFQRFASFADDHVYVIKASCQPVNYSGTVEIFSGLDLRTKTNGQIVTTGVRSETEGHTLFHEAKTGTKYGFPVQTVVAQELLGADGVWEGVVTQDYVAHKITFEAQCGQRYELEKKISLVTGRDPIDDLTAFSEAQRNALDKTDFQTLLTEHLAIYQELMGRLDIRIEGDFRADSAVRFCNYHTLISLERNDAVHSFSAKGLTGETYCGFVWWDAEIYQLPPLLFTMPEQAKTAILYRYNHLEQARQIAAAEGRRGARYPFTAGVTGLETVWKDVRHPFMQVHCVSDVALGVIEYYTATGDEAFLREKGMEMLLEICRYWLDRVEWDDERKQYVILQVTGTDEHHPYVDNNAYTNYSVARVLRFTLSKLAEYGSEIDAVKEKIGFAGEEAKEFSRVLEKLYLPFNPQTGMIPQFDGYFDLSRELEVVEGTSKGGYTQMKQSGLYHLSQVIKQPDVLMLFAYQNLPVSKRVYQRNFDYYEARCEAASSLAYCVHSICGSDMDMPEHAYGYLMRTAELDLLDAHGGTKDGIHSGCAAGTWMAVVRGIAGMKMTETGVSLQPHFIPWWEKVSFNSVWHGLRYKITLTNSEMTVTADSGNNGLLPLTFCGTAEEIAPGAEKVFEIAKETAVEV